MDGLQEVRTVLETDFGQTLCDINYFGGLGGAAPEERIFVCGQYTGAGEEAATGNESAAAARTEMWQPLLRL
jgi:hypothetical protein